MKLDELMGVKKFKDMTYLDILHHIGVTGPNPNIKLLGDGANAIALQIGDTAYKFWLIDDAYTNFVEYCLQHQDNPYLPKFLSKIKTIPAFFLTNEDAPKRVNYIKMELLKPVIGRLEIPLLEEELGVDVDIEVEEFFNFYDVWLRTDHGTTHETFLEYLKDNSLIPGDYEWENLSSKIQLLVDTLVDLLNIAHEELDIHQYNYMRRVNQLVIIDPMADVDSMNINDDFIEWSKEHVKNPEANK